MDAKKTLEQRRETIIEEMRSIRSMKRGTISEQYLKVKHKGKEKPVERGPYYVFARSVNGKTVSRRLTSRCELERTRNDIASYKRFTELCREFAEITGKLGELEGSSEAIDALKKTSKSKPKRRKNST